jgi:hypothetical protein
MLDRIMGVITLKAPTYRKIADDKSLTGEAAIIVVVMAVFSAILGALVLSVLGASLPQGGVQGTTLGFIVRTILTTIIGWLVGSWVIAFVAKTFFGGKTDTSEMLRVFGYLQVFSILQIVPVCGALVGLVLSLIGAVIGIREAAEFDTTKAVLTAIIAFVILLIVFAILGTILAIVGLV